MRNRFLSLGATCSPRFKQYHRAVPSQKNPNFQPSQLHSHRWQRRRASEISQCSPVCPFENDNCCMARLLSKQEDFRNQISMLETVIREAGHECIFLPKFHCELNPIEMVGSSYLLRYSLIYFLSTIVLPDGLSIGIVKSTRTRSKTPKTPLRMPSTHVPSRWSDDSSTARGDGCRHTAWDSQERPHSGPYASKKVIAVPQGLPAMMHLDAVFNGS